MHEICELNQPIPKKMKLGHPCKTQMHKFGFVNVHLWLDKLSPKSCIEIKFIWRKNSYSTTLHASQFCWVCGWVCLFVACLFLYCLPRYQIVSMLKESPGVKLRTHRKAGRTWLSPPDFSSTLSEGSCQCSLYPTGLRKQKDGKSFGMIF